MQIQLDSMQIQSGMGSMKLERNNTKEEQGGKMF